MTSVTDQYETDFPPCEIILNLDLPMRRIMLNSIRLTLPVWIDQLCDNQRLVIHAVSLGYCQWISLHCLDWSPDINDLNSSLEQLLRLLRKMMWDS